MDSLGELLRSAREAKGLSLNKVEDETKIRKKYLQALEEEKYDVLPGRVYTKGFLRIYAKYLGLNEEQVMQSYSHVGLTHSENPVPSVTRLKKKRKSIKVAASRKTYLITVVTAVFAVLTLFAYSYFSQKAVPASNPNEKPGAAERPDSGQIGNPTNASGQQEQSLTDDKTSQQPLNNDLELKLVGSVQVCWARVRVDGTVAFEGNINPGETKIFAGKIVRITLGNAGAVEVIKDGKSLGFLGSYGQVRNREFKVDTPTG